MKARWKCILSNKAKFSTVIRVRVEMCLTFRILRSLLLSVLQERQGPLGAVLKFLGALFEF